MWALIIALGSHENVRQREFVKTISLITSAVLTQHPVLHKICAMYPTCTMWTSLPAGNFSEQCRSPFNNSPFNLYWAFVVAQQDPQTLSRCLADAEMLCCTSALQTLSTPIRPFDRLCLLLSLPIWGVDGSGLSLHPSGSFPFSLKLFCTCGLVVEYRTRWCDVCLSVCLPLKPGLYFSVTATP